MALTFLYTFIVFSKIVFIEKSVGGSIGQVLRLEKMCEDGRIAATSKTEWKSMRKQIL